MTASEIIKAELTDSGRTQTWLVKKINEAGMNMNKQRLNDTLNGKRRLNADEFIIICRALNLTIDSFSEKKSTDKK